MMATQLQPARTQRPHKALRIAELLRAIFDEAVPTIDSLSSPELANERFKNLHNFALCCRDFLEPALDLLWAYLPSTTPAFRLILSGFINGIMVATKILDDKTWRRFFFYADRVRSIHVLDSECPRHAVCQRLIIQLSGRPLLRGLTAIHWTFNSSMFRGTANLAPLLISEGLKEFVLDETLPHLVHPCSRDFSTLLATLRQRAKHVRRVNIVLPNTDNATWSSVTVSLIQSSQLSHVEIMGIARAECLGLIRDLARLPLIQTLKVNSHRDDLISIPTFNVVSQQSGLRGEVRLTASLPAAQLRDLFEYLPPLDITALTLRCLSHERDGLEIWRICAANVLRHSGTIRSVTISQEYGLGRGNSPSAISLMRIWFPFHRLRNFSLEFYFVRRFAVTETDIHAMASAWPELESFDVRLGEGGAIPLAWLQLFAQTCPKLLFLCLPLGGSIPSLDEVPPLSHGLRNLAVCARLLHQDSERQKLEGYVRRLFSAATMSSYEEDFNFERDFAQWLYQGEEAQ